MLGIGHQSADFMRDVIRIYQQYIHENYNKYGIIIDFSLSPHGKAQDLVGMTAAFCRRFKHHICIYILNE